MNADLARAAVAAPGFRWMSGMRVRTSTGAAYTVVDVAEPDSLAGRTYAEPVIYPERPAVIGGGHPYAMQVAPDAVTLDLNDPATKGCLLALVREQHGPGAAVARDFTGLWGIIYRSELGAEVGWPRLPALRGHPTEAHALVAGLGGEL